MSRISLIMGATIASVMFAKANEGSAGLPGKPAAEPATEAKPAIADVRSDIPVPEHKSGRGGGKSPYGFETMEVGQSRGIVGRTKASFASILYNLNKSFAKPVLNEDGSEQKETKVRKDKDGNETRKVVTVTERTREYKAFDVDPKTDPDGASVRIFRLK